MLNTASAQSSIEKVKYRCHDDKNNLLPEGMTTAQTQSSNERRYNYVMMIKNNLLRMTTASTQSSRESKYSYVMMVKKNLLPGGMTTAPTQSSGESKYYVMMIMNNLLPEYNINTKHAEYNKIQMSR